MPAPPDQFQKRTYVRLPYTDEYLKNEFDRAVLAQIRKSFERPLLRVKISDSPSAGAGVREDDASGRN